MVTIHLERRIGRSPGVMHPSKQSVCGRNGVFTTTRIGDVTCGSCRRIERGLPLNELTPDREPLPAVTPLQPEPQPHCIVCGHKLSVHIDEGDQWRCHSIVTADMSQCECRLQKSVADEEGISWFEAERRVKEAMEEALR
jgi:hypothetical protein